MILVSVDPEQEQPLGDLDRKLEAVICPGGPTPAVDQGERFVKAKNSFHYTREYAVTGSLCQMEWTISVQSTQIDSLSVLIAIFINVNYRGEGQQSWSLALMNL